VYLEIDADVGTTEVSLVEDNESFQRDGVEDMKPRLEEPANRRRWR